MHRLAYRNFGRMTPSSETHSVDNGGWESAVRWYEVRNPGGTPSVYQQGTYAPDGDEPMDGEHCHGRSVATSRVGYSASSRTSFPSVAYTGRLATDPLGTLQTESVIVTAQVLKLEQAGGATTRA